MNDSAACEVLQKLREDGLFRELFPSVISGAHASFGGAEYINLASNDYLGISADADLQREFLSSLDCGKGFIMGACSSRLLGGRSLRKGKITQNAGVGMTLSLIGYTLFALVEAPWAYYSAAMIIGLGNGHMCPAYQTMFINLAPNSQRGTANSSFLTSWDVGLGLGVLVGGWAAEFIGYHGAFEISAAVNAVGVIGIFMYVRRNYLANRLR